MPRRFKNMTDKQLRNAYATVTDEMRKRGIEPEEPEVFDFDDVRHKKIIRMVLDIFNTDIENFDLTEEKIKDMVALHCYRNINFYGIWILLQMEIGKYCKAERELGNLKPTINLATFRYNSHPMNRIKK